MIFHHRLSGHASNEIGFFRIRENDIYSLNNGIGILPGDKKSVLSRHNIFLGDLSKRMLGELGYNLLTASTPGEAIRLAEEYPGEIHLLMTDVVMPEMNGRDLAKKMLSLYPRLKSLFMSGYTADVIAHHGVLDEDVHFIQKPFSRKDIAANVREALDQK